MDPDAKIAINAAAARARAKAAADAQAAHERARAANQAAAHRVAQAQAATRAAAQRAERAEKAEHIKLVRLDNARKAAAQQRAAETRRAKMAAIAERRQTAELKEASTRKKAAAGAAGAEKAERTEHIKGLLADGKKRAVAHPIEMRKAAAEAALNRADEAQRDMSMSSRGVTAPTQAFLPGETAAGRQARLHAFDARQELMQTERDRYRADRNLAWAQKSLAEDQLAGKKRQQIDKARHLVSSERQAQKAAELSRLVALNKHDRLSRLRDSEEQVRLLNGQINTEPRTARPGTAARATLKLIDGDRQGMQEANARVNSFERNDRWMEAAYARAGSGKLSKPEIEALQKEAKRRNAQMIHDVDALGLPGKSGHLATVQIRQSLNEYRMLKARQEMLTLDPRKDAQSHAMAVGLYSEAKTNLQLDRNLMIGLKQERELENLAIQDRHQPTPVIENQKVDPNQLYSGPQDLVFTRRPGELTIYTSKNTYANVPIDYNPLQGMRPFGMSGGNPKDVFEPTGDDSWKVKPAVPLRIGGAEVKDIEVSADGKGGFEVRYRVNGTRLLTHMNDVQKQLWSGANRQQQTVAQIGDKNADLQFRSNSMALAHERAAGQQAGSSTAKEGGTESAQADSLARQLVKAEAASARNPDDTAAAEHLADLQTHFVMALGTEKGVQAKVAYQTKLAELAKGTHSPDRMDEALKPYQDAAKYNQDGKLLIYQAERSAFDHAHPTDIGHDDEQSKQIYEKYHNEIGQMESRKWYAEHTETKQTFYRKEDALAFVKRTSGLDGKAAQTIVDHMAKGGDTDWQQGLQVEATPLVYGTSSGAAVDTMFRVEGHAEVNPMYTGAGPLGSSGVLASGPETLKAQASGLNTDGRGTVVVGGVQQLKYSQLLDRSGATFKDETDYRHHNKTMDAAGLQYSTMVADGKSNGDGEATNYSTDDSSFEGWYAKQSRLHPYVEPLANAGLLVVSVGLEATGVGAGAGVALQVGLMAERAATLTSKLLMAERAAQTAGSAVQLTQAGRTATEAVSFGSKAWNATRTGFQMTSKYGNFTAAAWSTSHVAASRIDAFQHHRSQTDGAAKQEWATLGAMLLTGGQAKFNGSARNMLNREGVTNSLARKTAARGLVLTPTLANAAPLGLGAYEMKKNWNGMSAKEKRASAFSMVTNLAGMAIGLHGARDGIHTPARAPAAKPSTLGDAGAARLDLMTAGAGTTLAGGLAVAHQPGLAAATVATGAASVAVSRFRQNHGPAAAERAALRGDTVRANRLAVRLERSGNMAGAERVRDLAAARERIEVLSRASDATLRDTLQAALRAPERGRDGVQAQVVQAALEQATRAARTSLANDSGPVALMNAAEKKQLAEAVSSLPDLLAGHRRLADAVPGAAPRLEKALRGRVSPAEQQRLVDAYQTVMRAQGRPYNKVQAAATALLTRPARPVRDVKVDAPTPQRPVHANEAREVEDAYGVLSEAARRGTFIPTARIGRGRLVDEVRPQRALADAEDEKSIMIGFNGTWVDRRHRTRISDHADDYAGHAVAEIRGIGAGGPAHNLLGLGDVRGGRARQKAAVDYVVNIARDDLARAQAAPSGSAQARVAGKYQLDLMGYSRGGVFASQFGTDGPHQIQERIQQLYEGTSFSAPKVEVRFLGLYDRVGTATGGVEPGQLRVWDSNIGHVASAVSSSARRYASTPILRKAGAAREGQTTGGLVRNERTFNGDHGDIANSVRLFGLDKRKLAVRDTAPPFQWMTHQALDAGVPLNRATQPEHADLGRRCPPPAERGVRYAGNEKRDRIRVVDVQDVLRHDAQGIEHREVRETVHYGPGQAPLSVRKAYAAWQKTVNAALPHNPYAHRSVASLARDLDGSHIWVTTQSPNGTGGRTYDVIKHMAGGAELTAPHRKVLLSRRRDEPLVRFRTRLALAKTWSGVKAARRSIYDVARRNYDGSRVYRGEAHMSKLWARTDDGYKGIGSEITNHTLQGAREFTKAKTVSWETRSQPARHMYDSKTPGAYSAYTPLPSTKDTVAAFDAVYRQELAAYQQQLAAHAAGPGGPAPTPSKLVEFGQQIEGLPRAEKEVRIVAGSSRQVPDDVLRYGFRYDIPREEMGTQTVRVNDASGKPVEKKQETFWYRPNRAPREVLQAYADKLAPRVGGSANAENDRVMAEVNQGNLLVVSESSAATLGRPAEVAANMVAARPVSHTGPRMWAFRPNTFRGRARTREYKGERKLLGLHIRRDAADRKVEPRTAQVSAGYTASQRPDLEAQVMRSVLDGARDRTTAKVVSWNTRDKTQAEQYEQMRGVDKAYEVKQRGADGKPDDTNVRYGFEHTVPQRPLTRLGYLTQLTDPRAAVGRVNQALNPVKHALITPARLARRGVLRYMPIELTAKNLTVDANGKRTLVDDPNRVVHVYRPGTMPAKYRLELSDRVLEANAGFGELNPYLARGQREMGNILDQNMYLIRVTDRATGRLVGGDAINPSWKGLDRDDRWEGADLPQGSVYLSHVFGEKGGGAQATLASEEMVARLRTGGPLLFLTRWPGAQALYSRLAVPVHTTSFQPEAARILFDRAPLDAPRPPKVPVGADATEQARLSAMHDAQVAAVKQVRDIVEPLRRNGQLSTQEKHARLKAALEARSTSERAGLIGLLPDGVLRVTYQMNIDPRPYGWAVRSVNKTVGVTGMAAGGVARAAGAAVRFSAKPFVATGRSAWGLSGIQPNPWQQGLRDTVNGTRHVSAQGRRLVVIYSGLAIGAGLLGNQLEARADDPRSTASFNIAKGSDTYSLHVPGLPVFWLREHGGLTMTLWKTGPALRGIYGADALGLEGDSPAFPNGRVGSPPGRPGDPASLTGISAARANLGEWGGGFQLGTNEHAVRMTAGVRVANGVWNLRGDVPAGANAPKGLSALTSATPIQPFFTEGVYVGPFGAAARDFSVILGPGASMQSTTKNPLWGGHAAPGNETVGRSRGTFFTLNAGHGKPEPDWGASKPPAAPAAQPLFEPRDTRPRDLPSPAAPAASTTPLQKQKPKSKLVLVGGDQSSLWRIAEKHANELLTNTERKKIREEGGGHNAIAGAAANRLMRLNGFDPRLADGVVSHQPGDPDSLLKGWKLNVNVLGK